MAIVHRNAQPFFYEGEKAMCLLVHGFTGSPSDMRVLGEYLKEKGFGVSCILLPGHGTSPEDMEKTAWPQWYGAVEDEYLRLKGKYPLVIPIGLSMGGILSLHLAAQHGVPGIVSLSTPIYLGNRKAYLAPLLQFIYKYHGKPVAAEQWQKELEEGHFYYTATPIKPLVSLLALIRMVKKELTLIQAPALIMQSWKDGTVNPRSAQYIYDSLRSDDKELIWLEKSGHVITLGQEREQVFLAVERFIQKVAGNMEVR